MAYSALPTQLSARREEDPAQSLQPWVPKPKAVWHRASAPPGGQTTEEGL